MIEFKHVIADPMGMYARPAGMMVKAVAGYASKITITAPTGTADARRLLVDEKKIKSSGAAGVIRPGKTAVQVIIGPKVQFVYEEFKKIAE